MNKNVGLNEAREAYEHCSKLTGNQKEACYLAFGIDGEAVEKYLQTVETLEDTLYPPYELYLFGYHISFLKK
jgi:hypothetical protein